jgi:F-box and WD-40 domain protein CDC4
MWNIRDGTVVRDLLTGINGVWQVVFEGRCCVAASNRNTTTMLDVWDFGTDEDDAWIGEPPGGIYDDDTEEEDDEAEEQADVDAMDQDLEADPSDNSAEHEDRLPRDVGIVDDNTSSRIPSDTEDEPMERSDGVGSSKWARSSSSRPTIHQRGKAPLAGSSLRRGNPPPLGGIPARLPLNETPTRPRIRPATRKR